MDERMSEQEMILMCIAIITIRSYDGECGSGKAWEFGISGCRLLYVYNG